MLVRAALIRLTIAVALLAGFLAAGGGARHALACSGVDPKTGDLNADGLTNSLDALSVDFYVAGLMKAPSNYWLGGADVNCDSTVNAIDASLILQDDAGLYQIRP